MSYKQKLDQAIDKLLKDPNKAKRLIADLLLAELKQGNSENFDKLLEEAEEND